MATLIYIPTSSVGGFLFSTSFPAFVICTLFMMAILTSVRGCLIEVLVCISLLISTVKHLSMFLCACCPSLCFLWRNVYLVFLISWLVSLLVNGPSRVRELFLFYKFSQRWRSYPDSFFLSPFPVTWWSFLQLWIYEIFWHRSAGVLWKWLHL